MSNTDRHPECHMRTSLGNCDPIGGFCTSVNTTICEALHKVTEPKTGHWVEIEDYNGDIHYQCDQCGEEFILIDGTPEDNNYWYCPNCGSYNRGVRKNERV